MYYYIYSYGKYLFYISNCRYADPTDLSDDDNETIDSFEYSCDEESIEDEFILEIKIGRSKDVPKRLESLQTANIDKLKVLHKFRCYMTNDIEKAIHKNLKNTMLEVNGLDLLISQNIKHQSFMQTIWSI